jgi:hypothetical protein
LIGVARQWSEVHAFTKSRASTHSNLINDSVIGVGDCDSTIVRDSTTEGLISSNCAAVAAQISRKEVSIWSNRYSIVDYHSRTKCAAAAGSTDLPPTNID